MIEAEWKCDDTMAFAVYEEEKRIAVLTMAKCEALIKEIENDAKAKHDLEKTRAKTKNEFDEITERYEKDKKNAFAAKESFNAELKFLTYAKLNDVDAIKYFRVGDSDDEETSDDEELRMAKAEMEERRKSGVRSAAASSGNLDKSDA